MTNEQFNEIISMARTKLLSKWPFLGYLTLKLRPRLAKPEDDVKTAGVSIDGTLVINAEFLSSLKPNEICGLLAHEVLHPALFCFQRMGDRKAIVQSPPYKAEVTLPDGTITEKEMPGDTFTLWNLAHDLSFNLMIKEASERLIKNGGEPEIKLPENGAIDEKYRDMSAEEIYDQIYQQAIQNSNGNSNGTMIYDGPGTGQGSIGDDMRNDLSSTGDGKKAMNGDAGAQRRISDDWKVQLSAARQMQEKSGRGIMPNWLSRLIDEINNPVIDWREQLSRWVGENGPRNDYSFRRPSRRSYAVNEYLPSLTKHGIADDVTILVDTSGSISQDKLREFISEISGICEDLSLSVRILVADSVVHADVKIDQVEELMEHLSGGGGSDFNPAFEILEKEQYEGVVIAFTDGDIGVPEMQPPWIKGALWVIGPNDHDPTNGKWGDVVKINS